MLSVIFITFIKIFFEFIRSQLLLFFGQKIDNAILFGYYKHVINLPLNFFSTRKTGEIISRFTDGVNIRQIISDTIFILTIDTLISIIGGMILLYLNKYLFFISIIILFVYTIIIGIFKKYIKNKNKEVLEDNAKLTSNIIENINGIETIKAYNLELEYESETEFKFLKFLKSGYERGVLYNIVNMLSSIIYDIGNYFIIWLGSIEVIKGKMTIGELLVFLSIMVYFLDPLRKIINLQSQIQIALVASERIGEILDLDLEKLKYKNFINLENLKKNIKIENLNFRYGSKNLTLKNINLEIKFGQKIALVGESGSGKTTLIKLLMKYYSFESGFIKIGDIDINEIDTHFIRNKISYVSQDTFLFNKTIKENLFLNENVSMEEVIKYCEKLNLIDFINSLPEKFETIIEENGTNLSGGQKQRLSILRALLKKPDILILDEATSNLDSITENSIKNIIDNLSITVIIIAHRLSTIKKSDKIFVFEKGEILEEGNHIELMNLKGKYYNYWEEQVN